MEAKVREDTSRTKRPHACMHAGCGRFRLLCAVVLVATAGVPSLLIAPGSAPANEASTNGETVHADPVAGELLVGFDPDADRARRRAVVEHAGASIDRMLGPLRVGVVHVAPGASAADVADGIRANSAVKFVEANYRVQMLNAPNDPMFGEQWSLLNSGGAGGKRGADIGVTRAWDVITGGPVTVGIVDTGIDADHPDLKANMFANPADPPNGLDDDGNGFVDDFHGADFLGNDGAPDDNAGHGTTLAGTIAAAGDNGIGMTGIAWQARLMALKFLDETGSGSMADAAEAIDYAVEHGARIINASWGGPDVSNTLYAAIQRAADRGVLFVAAAGNDGKGVDQEPMYPASFDLPNIISVASSDRDDRLSSFSNYGATSVDLAAPGEDIVSTVPPSVDPSGYLDSSGTSIATPAVSGAAVLYTARFPSTSALQTREALLSSVDPVTSMQGKTATGGRLDVGRALGLSASGRSNIRPSAFQLRSPLNGFATKRRELRLTWRRSHDFSGIRSYRVYVDGQRRGTVRDAKAYKGRRAPYVIVRLRPGRHTWFVRAFDKTGKSRVSTSVRGFGSSSTLTVTKRATHSH